MMRRDLYWKSDLMAVFGAFSRCLVVICLLCRRLERVSVVGILRDDVAKTGASRHAFGAKRDQWRISPQHHLE